MEELAARLVERGLRVTVYCRSHLTPKGLTSYRGAELVVLPSLRTKYLETPIHTLLSCLDASHRGFDAALVVNSANALFLPLLSIAGIRHALHVDGIEKRRAKWGAVGRAVYALSERLACVLPDVLVTDAEVIRRHYEERYGATSTAITYGVDPDPPQPPRILEELNLKPRGYFLYVSRFEPENNPHRVVEAYARVQGEIPMIMVGDAPYAGNFIRAFKERADARVHFPGAIYGEGYRGLMANALAYVQATEVGGTHPALVEAMGYGNCVLVNNTPENREVAGDAGLYFRAGAPHTLSEQLEWVRAHPSAARQRGKRAAQRAADRYSWDAVSSQYAQLFQRLAG